MDGGDSGDRSNSLLWRQTGSSLTEHRHLIIALEVLHRTDAFQSSRVLLWAVGPTVVLVLIVFKDCLLWICQEGEVI